MRRRACVVVTSEMTVRAFMVPQLTAMQAHYDVTLVVHTSRRELLQELGVTARLWPLPIQRGVSLFLDLRCFLALIRLMWAERFDLVHSMTPKAGLLAISAAWLTRIPVRVHTFTGQVWATRGGLPRLLLRLLDTIVARAATLTLADSPSQRDFLVNHGVARASDVAVLEKGSVSGVDATRFRPDPTRRRTLRERWRIAPDDIVLLFVGRLTRDKGVLDLAHAFAALADTRTDLHLMVVGPDEEHISAAIRDLCGRHVERVHFCEFSPTPEHFMAAADVLCLPSYREGFGNVIIEAAAAGVPAVASRIPGVVDAVVEGVTGLLHEPAEVDSLIAVLQRVLSDEELRRALGSAARRRAARDFSPGALTTALLRLYAGLLDAGPEKSCLAESEEWAQ